MSPRYSIIRGDFPEDQRADVGHFRVYTLIGRHTDENGWCRLKQLSIGEEVGLSRKTVNLKISDLVAWGYVEKRVHDGSGRAIWYRTIMDKPVAPPNAVDAPDTDDVADAEDGAGPVTRPLQSGCNSEPSCNLHRVTPGVTTGRNTERPLLNDLPPLPPNGGDSGKSVDEQWKAEALTALRATGRSAEAVEHLIAPLLASDKRLSLGRGGERLAALAELAEQAQGLGKPALEAAAARLKAHPHKLTARAVRAEIDVAIAAGAMIVIRSGSPQWQRWLEFYEATDARAARAMGEFGVRHGWQVPSEWPPAKSQPSGGAA